MKAEELLPRQQGLGEIVLVRFFREQRVDRRSKPENVVLSEERASNEKDTSSFTILV